jgi:post-segregation antitoxin (ccd killing protein)
VDITVYLPDEVAQRAKAQNVNLSRVLRDALTAQFAEEDAVSATL